MKRRQITRYLLMISIYSFIVGGILYAVQEVSRYYSFEYETWTLIDWGLFFSAIFFLGCLFLYLTAFFVECLDEVMNRFFLWIAVKTSATKSRITETIERLDKRLKEITEDD